MPRFLFPGILGALAIVFTTGCEKRLAVDPDGKPILGEDGKQAEVWAFVGQPDPSKRWVAPHDVTDFKKLYTKYCLACHSIDNETVSPVVAMDNPVYLSILPEETLRSAIVNGIPGTLMPPFSKKNGGEMTDEQVDIVVKGILALRPATVDPTIPAYSAPLGDPVAGKALYEQSVYAKATDVEHSMLSPAFLGTVSNQYLRTLLIAGLPGLTPAKQENGHGSATGSHTPVYPDFRGVVPGKTLTSQDISDLVAWIASHRENEFGQRINAPSSVPPTALPATPGSEAAPQVP